jgi:hypothetical protein
MLKTAGTRCELEHTDAMHRQHRGTENGCDHHAMRADTAIPSYLAAQMLDRGTAAHREAAAQENANGADPVLEIPSDQGTSSECGG